MINSYTAYWPASVRAAKLPSREARTILEPFLVPDYLDKELDGAADWRKKNLEPWGHVTVHVTKVQIDGRTARLNDCQDASTAGVANAKTHRLIPDTSGTERVPIRAELQQGEDGRWRISKKEILETPCMPTAS